jgi:hypothetical protein
MERIKATTNPPTPQKFEAKTQKRRRHHQNALWGFLATLPAIGCIYAPDFDGANLQGVLLDSLESFISIGAGKLGETSALRAFLHVQC